eukprot:2066717-Amphidinium_carterae.1
MATALSASEAQAWSKFYTAPMAPASGPLWPANAIEVHSIDRLLCTGVPKQLQEVSNVLHQEAYSANGLQMRASKPLIKQS